MPFIGVSGRPHGSGSPINFWNHRNPARHIHRESRKAIPHELQWELTTVLHIFILFFCAWRQVRLWGGIGFASGSLITGLLAHALHSCFRQHPVGWGQWNQVDRCLVDVRPFYTRVKALHCWHYPMKIRFTKLHPDEKQALNGSVCCNVFNKLKPSVFMLQFLNLFWTEATDWQAWKNETTRTTTMLTCLITAHRGSPFSASDCAARSLHFASQLTPVAAFHHGVLPRPSRQFTVDKMWSCTPPDWAGLLDHGSSFPCAAGINHIAGGTTCLMLPSKRVFVFLYERAASFTEPQYPWRRYLWSY